MSRQTPPPRTAIDDGSRFEHQAITAWLRGEPLCPSCSAIVEDALQRNRDAILRDAYAAHGVAPAEEARS